MVGVVSFAACVMAASASASVEGVGVGAMLGGRENAGAGAGAHKQRSWYGSPSPLTPFFFFQNEQSYKRRENCTHITYTTKYQMAERPTDRALRAV